MMKRVLKWLLILFLLAVGALVVLFLSRDAIARRLVISNIRAQTGMVAEMGSFHFGLREPVVTIKNFKLHNPAGFGDTPFLVIPEIHVEYDKLALTQNKIHLTLVRFNLGELDIVKNEAGKTNLLELGVRMPSREEINQVKKGGGLAELKKRGYDFAGVDELTVSIGTAKFIDLKNPANNREQKIGIEKQTVKNVKSRADLAGLGLLFTLRSDNFFTDIFGGDVWQGLK